MKSFTDIEQSKKLAKILPIESADIWYAEIYEGKTVGYDYIVSDTPYYSLSLSKPSENNYSQNTVKDIPCWSLAALLSVYPMVVGRDLDMYCCWQNSKNLHSRHYDNPIDACVEMIVKLKEKGLI